VPRLPGGDGPRTGPPISVSRIGPPTGVPRIGPSVGAPLVGRRRTERPFPATGREGHGAYSRHPSSEEITDRSAAPGVVEAPAALAGVDLRRRSPEVTRNWSGARWYVAPHSVCRSDPPGRVLWTVLVVSFSTSSMTACDIHIPDDSTGWFARISSPRTAGDPERPPRGSARCRRRTRIGRPRSVDPDRPRGTGRRPGRPRGRWAARRPGSGPVAFLSRDGEGGV